MADGDGQGTEGQAPEGTATDQNQQGQGEGQQAESQSTQGQAPEGEGTKTRTDLKSLPQDIQDLIGELRTEAASKRVDTKTAKQEAEAETARKIGLALGILKEDAKPDADALAAQAAEQAAQATAAQRELAVFKAAPKDVDVQGLLDSRSFLDSIASVEPGDSAGIKKAIDDAVKARPSLKIVAGPTKSGGDLGGGGGQEKPGGKTPTGLEGALKSHYSKPQA